jgi:hypothetical protein
MCNHIKHFLHCDNNRASGSSGATTPDQLSITSANVSVSNNKTTPPTKALVIPPALMDRAPSPVVPATSQPLIIPDIWPITNTPGTTPQGPSANPSTGPTPFGAHPTLPTPSNTKQTARAGFKAFLKIVNASVDAFGPLKAAVGGRSQCVKLFEVRSITDQRPQA